MNTTSVTLPQARLELALLQAEADMVKGSDIYIRFTEMGFSSELSIRLKALMDFVKQIGDEMISVGKIIVLKFFEFVEKHPNLAAGIALGAVVSLLISSVPFLGPVLAPLALPLGIAVGAVVGHRMDKAQGGPLNGEFGFLDIAQDVIEIARAFFGLFIETLTTISAEFGQ